MIKFIESIKDKVKKKIQDTKYKIQNTRNGFTLIEMLVVFAIVGILAGAVIVSMERYGVKARTSQVEALASSLLPKFIACYTSGNKVIKPPANSTSSTPICEDQSGTDLEGYGYWPKPDFGDEGLPKGYEYVLDFPIAIDKNNCTECVPAEICPISDFCSLCCHSLVVCGKKDKAVITCWGPTYDDPKRCNTYINNWFYNTYCQFL